MSTRSDKWLRCSGHQLKTMAKAGLHWLDANHQHVNELNVFPVPDGDTGTNMLLTMRSAVARIESSEEEHVGKVAAQLAQGALMGARGNSGVILSQIWRGLAHGLQDKATFQAHDLAVALRNAADTAYKGVMRPVEGTILTVIQAGANEAADAVRKSNDLRFVLERVLERCEQTLERTPTMLPILAQAGVVDSGGQGLVYILQGMLRYAHGELDLEKQITIHSSNHVGPDKAVSLPPEPGAPAQAHVVPEGGELEFPYDVQFILLGQGLDVTAIRDMIDAMGDSTVVVGDETTVKVHIHVKDPGQPLSYGAKLGAVTDVVVENMQAQMEEIVGPTSAAPAKVVAKPQAPLVEPGQIGVVTVASGEGLLDIFMSLGAAYIVNGGQTNNPSTEELYEAIQQLPTDKVILLPNNKNIFLAAEAARDLSEKQVVVIPTRSVPQGISALLSLNADGDLAEVAANMTVAARQVATGEITTATRSVTLDDVEVQEGAIIGLVDGHLCASSPDFETVLDQMLVALEISEREILSIYYGADVVPEEAEALAEKIEETNPHLEVEVLAGGQKYYFYILGAE